MKNITLDGVEYTPVIKKPIILEQTLRFEIYPNNLGYMSWNNAKKACEALGEGWRLPTKEELNIMYENKDLVIGFAGNYYWSSTEYDFDYAWYQYFTVGYRGNSAKNYSNYVRAIRAF